MNVPTTVLRGADFRLVTVKPADFEFDPYVRRQQCAEVALGACRYCQAPVFMTDAAIRYTGGPWAHESCATWARHAIEQRTGRRDLGAPVAGLPEWVIPAQPDELPLSAGHRCGQPQHCGLSGKECHDAAL